MKKSSAFTLIELLIVVAIIAILAAIAVPNFLEAQVRAKVARVKADMRTVATAVEAYTVDNNKPIVRRDNWQNPDPNATRTILPLFREKIYSEAAPDARVGMRSLTTPLSYLTSLPQDVFHRPATAIMSQSPFNSDCIDYMDALQTDSWMGPVNRPYSSKGRGRGWTLFSVGPDSYVGNTGMPNQGQYPTTTNPRVQNTYWVMYDPSNGTVSSGNIFRFQGNLEQKDILFKPLLPSAS